MLSWCCVVSMHTLVTLHGHLLWKYWEKSSRWRWFQDDYEATPSNYNWSPQQVGIWSPHVFVQNFNGETPTLMLGGQVLFHNVSCLLQTYPHFIKYPPLLLCPSLQPPMVPLAYALPCSPNVPTSRQPIMPSWATYPLFLSLTLLSLEGKGGLFDTRPWHKNFCVGVLNPSPIYPLPLPHLLLISKSFTQPILEPYDINLICSITMLLSFPNHSPSIFRWSIHPGSTFKEVHQYT